MYNCFAQLDTLLQSDQPVGDQIAIARQLVTARPDLCEFSRAHSEFGGKNECRFMWRYFKVRLRQLFRILAKLRWVATSQDKSFERALAFVLANHRRHTDWLTLDGKGESVLTPQDLDWVPAKWWIGPLSGHESKLEDEERRQILIAYGTGLGPTQVAKSVSGVSDRQIALVNQRHVTTEKLEATICEVINAYNRFWLPRLWGDATRAGADGTKWDLYENNLLSEYHIRYGSWGVSRTTMSVTLTLLCSPILFLAAFGRRSIFLTG